MRRDEILAWVKAERLGLADFLVVLDENEWQADSLCPGWPVRDVAAHLTLSTRTTALVALRGVIRARGDVNRMSAELARERATSFTPAQLVAQLRETARSDRRVPGTGLLDPLVDVLMHGQDIARPLGRLRRMPAELAVAALDHVRNTRFYGAHTRLRGMRLVATDCEWSAGEGPDEIRGPAGDLLMVAIGRAARPVGLSGPGTERLGGVR